MGRQQQTVCCCHADLQLHSSYERPQGNSYSHSLYESQDVVQACQGRLRSGKAGQHAAAQRAAAQQLQGRGAEGRSKQELGHWTLWHVSHVAAYFKRSLLADSSAACGMQPETQRSVPA